MNKIKKIFNKLAVSLALIGSMTAGVFFTNAIPQGISSTNADFSQYEKISNNLPEYLEIKTPDNSLVSEAVGKVDNTIYLFQQNSYKDVIIADDTIVNSGNPDQINYAYIPATSADESLRPTQYYYFDFHTSLSLYHNLTNKDVQSGKTGENLLKNSNIANFTQAYSADGKMPFAPTGYSFNPQQFNLKFKLNTALEQTSVLENTISLNKEGCYTLAIPVSVYSTENDGLTFVLSETTIYYSFMVFNADTYFDTVTGRPKISTSNNLQESQLTQSSAYSNFYFYNYSYGKSVNTLPTISYNPERFELRVEYTDLDQRTHTAVIEYINGEIIQLDQFGKVLLENDQFLNAQLISDKIVLSFTEIGSYDLSIGYLYISNFDGNQTTYRVPLEELENNSIFNNKPQRLYLYGYQAVFSDYSSVDAQTGQPESKELKTFDIEKSIYENSADITSSVNDYIIKKSTVAEDKTYAQMQNPSKSGNFDLKNLTQYAVDYINANEVIPVTTNQTPIKFLTNAKLAPSFSKIYKVSGETGEKTIDEGSQFQGFNQNSAGTYLYVIQYTFDSYMSTSGTLQNAFYHYQVFYFTVTNTTPTITVYDETFKEIYTGGYTNKDVYILNDAENNIFDAKVDISLSAWNYKENKYYFTDTNVKNLNSYGIVYQQFEKSADSKDEQYNQKIAENWGIKIENDSPYANALFTINVKSANTDQPSTRTFTIDTNSIANITARNASISSSTAYRVGNGFEGYATNNPFILSWDEKPSKATTYGYIKHIPLTSINYYTSIGNDELAALLSRLIEHEMLPVSYKIDINQASSWTEYKNTSDYTSTVPATNVKSNDGIYILEIYDQAGNCAFDVFIKDSTSPIFVQKIESRFSTMRKLFANNQTISVPESNVKISIEWTNNKAIYLDNLDAFTTFKAYQYGIDVENANQALSDLLSNFFNAEKNSSLKTINNITVETNKTNASGLATTGLNSYNGTYLIVPISNRAYIKDAKSSDYAPVDANKYEITFVDENNMAIEGTYKIIVRDNSNTDTYSNEASNYKLYPSGYLVFNVTSDASKMMVKFDNGTSGSSLDYSSYSITGNLFEYEDENKEIQYSHIEVQNSKMSDLTYKFMYHTPVKATRELYLSYVPVAENGSRLASIVLKYYPYELKSMPYEYKENDIIKTKYYYYYDIATEPTRTVNVFTLSNKTYDAGAEEVFSIALGSDSYPLAGRYIIERTYVEGNDIDQYDFYKRTITFVVDNFNLISPLESITDNVAGEPSSSLESVVGGDIVLSMYSGADLSSIEVSFPSYNDKGLNTGSFYTKDSFDEHEDLAIYAIEGNKLPMSLYIPKYKYTVANYRSVSNKGKTGYSVQTNDNLSYYGNATYKLNPITKMYDIYTEGVVVASVANELSAIQYINDNISIVEYEILVEVRASIVENGKTVTKYYYSNGQSSNGYLNLYLADGKNGNIIDATIPTEFFYQKGNYVVTIYQSGNDPQSNIYNFYRFGFKIISESPDFAIYGSDNYLLTETKTPNVYYTNSDLLTIEWQLPLNKYHAKIDENAIEIKYFPGSANAGRSEIFEGAGTKYFTIDASRLIEAENSYVEITMQYEGFNAEYYNKITKRIYFDRSAPIQNLSNLMTLTDTATNSAFPINYQQYFMRKYFDYKNDEIEVSVDADLSKMSYSYSQDTGYFKYFSYNVTSDFFNNTLKSVIKNASSLPYDTQYIYYQNIPNIQSYTQVDKSSFSDRNYFWIDVNAPAEVVCGYYEIVELDYAGNMTVYLVYVVDSINQDDENVSNEALSYVNNTHKTPITITNDQITKEFNIYSNSGFKLTNLNYKSDPWALLNVTLSGKTSERYMKSPWIDENSIYKVSFTASGITFEICSLSNIFDAVASSSSKHQLVLTDRISGTNTLVYLSLMDASLTTNKVEDPNKSSAILNINVPTKAQYQSTTTSYAFPTQITIKQFDKSIEGTDKWKTIMVAGQTIYGEWRASDEQYETALEYISFNTIGAGNILQVVINLGEKASQKIKYEIVDNFGNLTTVIQLANEISYKEISGDSNVYQITETDNTITYISSQTVKYSYNILLYNIAIFDKDGNDVTNTIERRDNATTNISVYSLVPTKENIYDDYYKIIVKDSETNTEIKTLHIRLVYNLPYFTYFANNVHSGGIIFNDKNQQPIADEYVNEVANISVNFHGKTYTSSGYSISSYDNVTIRFKNGQDYAYDGTFAYDYGYTYSVYLSKDNGETWENINSDSSAISGHTITEVGDYIILIKYDSESIFTNLCKLFTVSVIDQNLYPLYSIRVDNLPVEKSGFKYTSKTNIEYEINYIVSVDYADKDNRLTILENEEKGVRVSLVGNESTGTNVQVEIYHYESESGLMGDFTIIYIDETNNIVSSFTYDSPVGTTLPLKNVSYEMVVSAKGQGDNYDKLKLNFSSFYGIKENKINIEVLKLFNGNYVKIDAPVYNDGEDAYINLERAGSYRLKVYDSCTPANVQSFAGRDYIDIVFLSYVPFIVSHVDEEGNTIVTEPIQKATYNSDVTIELINVYNDSYYQRTPQISVLFNGKAYTNFTTYKDTFTFSEPGFYTVKFSAESKSGIEIREEEFNFTIAKKNEIRYAYEFAQFNKYYIEKIEKDGTDITDALVELGNFKTVNIGNKKYLSAITLSHSLLDEKTGDGRYKITVNVNSNGYENVVGERFTFEIRIGHVTNLPINISIAEGASTSNKIVVTFNIYNLHNLVGDCYISISGITKYYTGETLSSYNEIETITITGAGTHYIQIYTLSGRPLFSYKVIKTEPLNAFAIIAIIVGVIALVAVIAITIKIRKRQKAK